VFQLLLGYKPLSLRTIPWLAADDWAYFTGSLTVAVLGGVLWWRERNVTRHLAFGLGVAATSVTVLMLPNTTGPDWIVGMVLAGVGVVWLALSVFELLPPKIVGLTLERGLCLECLHHPRQPLGRFGFAHTEPGQQPLAPHRGDA
jgi:hypothetical protein